MLRKTHQYPALLACTLAVSASLLQAQPVEPAPAPITVVAPATLNRLFTEAEAAFTAKDYDKAIATIRELLQMLGGNKDAPLELLHFNIGLGYLLGEKYPEAEAAFTECLKKFPNGEYASRSYLGVGRAAIMQDTPEKKLRAVDALVIAAKDPKFRSEAGLWLGRVYNDLGRREDALKVLKSLMGSDIRSPQQTTAAVEVIALLADSGDLVDLVAYLDRLINQAGVRDAMAWYANQVIVRGDELVASQAFDSALAIYRSVPPRHQIIEIQTAALNIQRRDANILEAAVARDKAKPLSQRTSASELLNNLKSAIALAEQALVAIDEKADLDAALLMRRGRCLFYLERYEEALVCFRALRTQHGTTDDAKSAAYAEIVILGKLKKIEEIKVLCEAFLRKYPDAENVEQVATLAGEVLVQEGDWAEVGKFYRGLEARFPKSESLDRYTFFQGVAVFQGGDFAKSLPIFAKFIKSFPQSKLMETAVYYEAMASFLTGDYKQTLQACKKYLSLFPDGLYAGDMRYRLAFIDFSDKETDQSDKIIKDLSGFLKDHPDDSAAGSMYCLLADTYKRKKSDKLDELAKNERLALESYKKAVWTDSSDEVIQYALDSATSILQGSKDWAGVAALHAEFLQRKPLSPLALLSATWIAKMKVREGKGAEAAEMLASSLKARIGDPASEQMEFLIDELVKTLVPPRKKPTEIDIDAIDKQLVDILNKAIGDQANATTSARLYYARARLAQLLRRPDRSDLHLKGIATINAKDPSVLSPALLAVSGDILLKLGNLDDAEAMFQRLISRYKDGMFADAGPVGLGYVALARKKPQEALEIFNNALENNPGMSRFKETSLGRLEALVGLGKLEEAEKLALETVGDRMFRGESAGKAYILLGGIYRKQAENAEAAAKLELLKKAHGTYQRVYIAYQSSPEVCAEAYWQAHETALELGDAKLAAETLQALLSNPKLENTERFKKAAKEAL